MIHAARAQQLYRLFSAIRAMHQRNRTVANLYGFSWSLAEAHATVEIAANPKISPTELGRRLGLNPVATARLLNRSYKQGLLRWTPSSTDGRARQLLLGPNAPKLLAQNLERNVATFGAAYDRLPPPSRRRFQSYLTGLCDRWPAPPASATEGEPPLMEEIRRFTRALGLLEERLTFAPWCSPLEWHVFTLIRERKAEGIPISVLCTGLAAPSRIIERRLRSLHRRELVKWGRRIRRGADRKVLLTPGGEKLLAELEESACRTFDRCLAELSTDQISEFADLWETYGGKHITPLAQAVTKGTILECTKAPGVTDKARGFVIEQRAKQRLLRSLPAVIIAEKSFVFVLYRFEGLAAVAEFDESAPGEWLGTHVLIDQQQVSDSTVRQLCPILLQNAFLITAARKITFKKPNTSAAVWKTLARKKRGGSTISFTLA